MGCLHNSPSFAFYPFFQIFEPLSDSAMRGVLNLMFSHMTKELKKRGITLEVSDSAKSFILDRAWSHRFGGRRMAKYVCFTSMQWLSWPTCPLRALGRGQPLRQRKTSRTNVAITEATKTQIDSDERQLCCFCGYMWRRYIDKYITAKIAPLVLSAKLKKGDKAQLRRAANQPNQLNLIVSILVKFIVCARASPSRSSSACSHV